MATPSYLNASHVNARIGDGVLARLGSYFGNGGTPAYAGSGQPSPAAGGLLRGSTPAYAAAPVREPVAQDAYTASAEDAVEAMECPIDPAALAAGQIAIVIPRERLKP